MNPLPNEQFIWHSEVRGYELDLQGIVNNAVYLQYFDHVRVQHLLALGVDWETWHKNGYNLVIIHVDLHFKSSLRSHDKFYVTSKIEKAGRLKFVFHQSIYTNDNKLIATAVNTGLCVSISNGKPTMPRELSALLFGSNAVE